MNCLTFVPSTRAGLTVPPSLLLALGIFLLSARPLPAAPPETDGQVAARETASELARAFANDGYKIRDGHWAGNFELKKPKVIAVNLYAGNQYYFSLGAAADKAKKVAVVVYDEAGKPVGGEEFYTDPDHCRAAAGVSPVASGPYYVSVQLLEGEAADFCLLYSYK